MFVYMCTQTIQSLQYNILFILAQEHMLLRLKKMEWECERTTMERVSVLSVM